MTEQEEREIDVEIAEAMPPCPVCGFDATAGFRCVHSPNYSQDLIAMRKAARWLYDTSRTRYAIYIQNLDRLCNIEEWPAPEDASAVQRAKAWHSAWKGISLTNNDL